MEDIIIIIEDIEQLLWSGITRSLIIQGLNVEFCKLYGTT